MQGSILNGIYRVESQLSKRGSRSTWLAKNLNTNEAVVIKILKFGLDAEWSDFRLFEREAQTLKNIDHPAIPDYLDYFELDLPDCKGFTLVQQYLAAPSLEETIKAGRTFSESEIREIAESLLNILFYLHQQQPSIIHRDIKPSNILLQDRSGNSIGQVYLIDFGAVKNVAAAERGTITVVGTYGYMPPEQFGGYTTPASDLYSLGSTLIYLATGMHPTELPSKDGKIAFSELVQLSYSLVRWLEQMIEPSCDKRFKSTTEALQVLQKPLLIEIQSKVDIARQPAFSRIKLQKSPTELNIVIPSLGLTKEVIALTVVAIAWNTSVAWACATLFVPGSLIVTFFTLPFWAVGIRMWIKVFFSIWGKTRLIITNKDISLTYECLKIKYQRLKTTSRNNITAIECPPTGWKIDSNGSKTQISSAIIIWANNKPYTLNTSIANKGIFSRIISNYNPAIIELDWLAQEISEWLDLPLTERKM